MGRDAGRRHGGPTPAIVIMATGCLSSARTPGLRRAWTRSAGPPTTPAAGRHEGVDFAGQRVGVIGTGSSGIQVDPGASREQAAELFVFQRTPNFTLPARNGPLDPGTGRAAYRGPPRRTARAGAPRAGNGTLRTELTTSRRWTRRRGARERVYEHRWDARRRRHRSVPSPTCSATRGQRHAGRLRARQDPRDRPRPGHGRGALPAALPVGAKRICLDTDYYETFNRPTTSRLVDLRETPIESLTPTGHPHHGARVRARRDRLRHRLRRDDRRAPARRHPRPGRAVAARRLGGGPAHVPGAGVSPASRTCSPSPGRAARRCSATWSSRSSSTSTGSATASCVPARSGTSTTIEADRRGPGRVGRARQRGGRPHAHARRPRPGTWARTCRASRGCSCRTSAGSAATGRSAKRWRPTTTAAS